MARLRAPFAFIPFVGQQIVRASYPVEATRYEPSYRTRGIALRSRQEGRLRTLLLESNTLTSQVYRPRAADSSFLFFSHRPIWARPLFGVANLTYGLLDTLGGVLIAPFDRARRLRRALRGVAVSAPELVFVNIRKGSFEEVPLGFRLGSRAPVRGEGAVSGPAAGAYEM